WQSFRPRNHVQEKREHPRSQITSPVRCQVEGEEPFDGLAKDISLGGMYIEASVNPPFAAKVSIVCQLPGTKEEATLPAVVRWVKPDGFGVQFGLLGARATHAITDLMRRPR